MSFLTGTCASGTLRRTSWARQAKPSRSPRNLTGAVCALCVCARGAHRLVLRLYRLTHAAPRPHGVPVRLHMLILQQHPTHHAAGGSSLQHVRYRQPSHRACRNRPVSINATEKNPSSKLLMLAAHQSYIYICASVFCFVLPLPSLVWLPSCAMCLSLPTIFFLEADRVG